MSAPSWIPRSRRNQRHRRNTNGIDLFDFDEFLVIIHNQDWENNPPKNRATQVFRNENISGKGGLRHTSHFVPASSSQQKERPPERLTISQQQLSSSFAIYHHICYHQLVRNTAVIKNPNSPPPISHIPEVISHLQPGYLLWATTGLPRTEEDLSIVETLGDPVWDITQPFPRWLVLHEHISL